MRRSHDGDGADSQPGGGSPSDRRRCRLDNGLAVDGLSDEVDAFLRAGRAATRRILGTLDDHAIEDQNGRAPGDIQVPASWPWGQSCPGYRARSSSPTGALPPSRAGRRMLRSVTPYRPGDGPGRAPDTVGSTGLVMFTPLPVGEPSAESTRGQSITVAVTVGRVQEHDAAASPRSRAAATHPAERLRKPAGGDIACIAQFLRSNPDGS